MASILKVTSTINVESDIIDKKAGELVDKVAVAIMPALTKAVEDFVNPPTKDESKK